MLLFTSLFVHLVKSVPTLRSSDSKLLLSDDARVSSLLILIIVSQANEASFFRQMPIRGLSSQNLLFDSFSHSLLLIGYLVRIVLGGVLCIIIRSALALELVESPSALLLDYVVECLF